MRRASNKRKRKKKKGRSRSTDDKSLGDDGEDDIPDLAEGDTAAPGAQTHLLQETPRPSEDLTASHHQNGNLPTRQASESSQCLTEAASQPDDEPDGREASSSSNPEAARVREEIEGACMRATTVVELGRDAGPEQMQAALSSLDAAIAAGGQLGVSVKYAKKVRRRLQVRIGLTIVCLASP